MSEEKCTYLGGLVVSRVEAFDSDLSEDMGLQRLLRQVAVVNDGWTKEEKHFILCTIFKSPQYYFNANISTEIQPNLLRVAIR